MPIILNMTRLASWTRWLPLPAILLFFTTVLPAQDPRGTIVGRVSDKSASIIPNLEVRAINKATSVAAVGRTTSAGDYRIGFLTPGVYTVTAESSGRSEPSSNTPQGDAA